MQRLIDGGHSNAARVVPLQLSAAANGPGRDAGVTFDTGRNVAIHPSQGILPGNGHPPRRPVSPTMKSRIDQLARKICTAAMLCAAAGASAQTIYRQVDGGGHVTFTDRTETTPLSQAAPAQGSDVATALARRGPMNSKDAATVDNDEAARRLARAQKNRGEGNGPRPGETADGAMVRKLNEYYLQDKKKQDREVAAAQKRSNQTSTGLDKP